MVNEINKPATDATENENAVLGERLLASNRNLLDMQAEHRQLMQEMESLRHRATELSQLSAQQQQEPIPEPKPTGVQEDATVANSNSSTTAAAATEPSVAVNEESADAEDDAESAEYIRAKFAEIAALKAQYARVQHMINTTNQIEQHIAAKEKATAESSPIPQAAAGNANVAASESDPVELALAGTRPSAAAIAADFPAAAAISNSDSAGANEELLSTMLNMFTDFTSELRSEADSLRAERDRLRALKEEIMRHRQQRPS